MNIASKLFTILASVIILHLLDLKFLQLSLLLLVYAGEIAIQDSYQQRVPEPGPSRKRIRNVDKQGMCSSVADGKGILPKIQCLSGRGRAHSMTRKAITACHILRSLRKGNYISHAKSKEAASEKKRSRVSKNKATHPPSKNQFQSGTGKSCGKKLTPKEEMDCSFTNLKKSHSQSHSKATETTFQKKTGPPQSNHQDSDAVSVGLVAEPTEGNFNSRLNEPPLTETVNAPNEKLRSQVSSLPTTAAEHQTPQEPSIQFLQAVSSDPNLSSSHTKRDSKVILI